METSDAWGGSSVMYYPASYRHYRAVRGHRPFLPSFFGALIAVVVTSPSKGGFKIDGFNEAFVSFLNVAPVHKIGK